MTYSRIEAERTFWVKLYLSGPIEEAKKICREYCLNVGLCVTIEPTTFIYTGGEEHGYVVGLINYPRFPSTDDELEKKARELRDLLLERTFQQSALMMTPTVTTWVSNRKDA